MTRRRPTPGGALGRGRVRAGDPLPDLPLVDADGREVSLAALGTEATLLIFLRHLS